MCPCSRSRQPSVATTLRQVPAPADDLAWRLLKDCRQSPRFGFHFHRLSPASAPRPRGENENFCVINLSAALTSSLACTTLLGVAHFKTLSQLQTQRHHAFAAKPKLLGSRRDSSSHSRCIRLSQKSADCKALAFGQLSALVASGCPKPFGSGWRV